MLIFLPSQSLNVKVQSPRGLAGQTWLYGYLYKMSHQERMGRAMAWWKTELEFYILISHFYILPHLQQTVQLVQVVAQGRGRHDVIVVVVVVVLLTLPRRITNIEYFQQLDVMSDREVWWLIYSKQCSVLCCTLYTALIWVTSWSE